MTQQSRMRARGDEKPSSVFDVNDPVALDSERAQPCTFKPFTTHRFYRIAPEFSDMHGCVSLVMQFSVLVKMRLLVQRKNDGCFRRWFRVCLPPRNVRSPAGACVHLKIKSDQ